MLFSYGSGRQRIDRNKKCRRIPGDFDGHGDAAVRHEAHHPMEHIQGFTPSNWMPSSGQCLHRIAPAAAMVDDFKYNTQNTNKTQLLATNYSTFRALVVCENFVTRNGPSTHVSDATSVVTMRNVTIKAEELANNSSYQTL
jgi:hypothetical protein